MSWLVIRLPLIQNHLVWDLPRGMQKKTLYTGLFYFNKVSWSPPPSPILPKKEIITRPNIDPMPTFGLNLVFGHLCISLHLSSHKHPPEMRPWQVKVTLYDISICCNKIFVIRLQFTRSTMKQIFILDYCPIFFT